MKYRVTPEKLADPANLNFALDDGRQFDAWPADIFFERQQLIQFVFNNFSSIVIPDSRSNVPYVVVHPKRNYGCHQLSVAFNSVPPIGAGNDTTESVPRFQDVKGGNHLITVRHAACRHVIAALIPTARNVLRTYHISSSVLFVRNEPVTLRYI